MDDQLDDQLEELFEKQKELDERIEELHDIYMSKPEWVENLCKAIRHEVDELEDEMNWKWWADDEEIDWQAAEIELIDVWHFLISLTRRMGMGSEDVVDIFREKNEINHGRQDSIEGRSPEGKFDASDSEDLVTCPECNWNGIVEEMPVAYREGTGVEIRTCPLCGTMIKIKYQDGGQDE